MHCYAAYSYIVPMIKFSLAVSHSENWSNAAKELETALAGYRADGDEVQLGWLYVTDSHAADLSSMHTYLCQKTRIDHWVGSVGMGICWHDGVGDVGEAFDRPVAAAMVSRHPRDSFMLLPRVTASTHEIPEAIRDWMRSRTPPFGVVHGDPTNGAVPTLIEALSAEMENVSLEVPGFLIGGLTSSRGAHFQLAGDVISGGLSGVLFAPDVGVATGLTQGCAPVGMTHRVTDCMENVVMTLNGEPALAVFKDDIGELLARDLNQVAGYIHAAFPVAGSDTGDYVVRNLAGIDPERGWMAIGGHLEAGDQLMFVRRDPASAEEDLIRMVRDLMDRLPGPARGGLYFSCVARGSNLFGQEGREMKIIGDIIKDVPLVGFFGQGEISNNRLYGYTGVLALFL